MGFDISSISSFSPKTVRLLSLGSSEVATGSVLVELDCSMSETHSSEAKPTEFEVETGEVISDHIIVKPRQLKIQAVITDAPLSVISNIITTGIGFIAPSTAKLGQFAPAVALAPALIQSLMPAARRSVTNFAMLIRLQQYKMPINVMTSLQFYKNMWITKISVPRDSRTGRMVLVDIEFTQLLLVKPDTVQLSALTNADMASALADKAKKEGEESELVKRGQQGFKDALKAVPGASQ